MTFPNFTEQRKPPLPSATAAWLRTVVTACAAAVFLAALPASAFAATHACAPGWTGQPLAPTDTLLNWRVEQDTGSSGALALVTNSQGAAIQLNWNISTGSWVQARYDFSPPIDLSGADIFGLTLRGDSNAPANAVTLMFADTNGVFFGYDMPGQQHGINQVSRPLLNLPVPKRLFYYFWGGSGGASAIDWSKIRRFYLVVKRPAAGQGGGAGQLTVSRLQHDRAADWPRQAAFAAIDTNRLDVSLAAVGALNYLLSQQQPTGLLVSWPEEASAKAWLYDQALALIALSREGVWQSQVATNQAAVAAQALARFLVQAQKPDGHWARAWDPFSGSELVDDGWVGDQAWCVIALSECAYRSGGAGALGAAKRGAQWLAARIGPWGGIQGYPSTEATVDAWWAMIATFRFPDAEAIRGYLMGPVWDADLRYWWRGSNDPPIAIDCATWLSAFARHPLVAQPDRGLAALSLVRRTLVTTSDDGQLCGLDGMGPVSIWNEGTAQYVAAGGEDAPAFFDTLLSQQNPDGSLRGSPDNWSTDAFGWLTRWRGLAPTDWFYFTIRGLPFPDPARDTDHDGMPDWEEYVAGTNPEDARSVFKINAAAGPGTNEVRLSWQSVSNRLYTVLETTDLAEGWHPVSGYEDVPGTGQRLEVITSPAGVRYYRVRCSR